MIKRKMRHMLRMDIVAKKTLRILFWYGEFIINVNFYYVFDILHFRVRCHFGG